MTSSKSFTSSHTHMKSEFLWFLNSKFRLEVHDIFLISKECFQIVIRNLISIDQVGLWKVIQSTIILRLLWSLSRINIYIKVKVHIVLLKTTNVNLLEMACAECFTTSDASMGACSKCSFLSFMIDTTYLIEAGSVSFFFFSPPELTCSLSISNLSNCTLCVLLQTVTWCIVTMQ